MKRVLVFNPNVWDRQLLEHPALARRYELIPVGTELSAPTLWDAWRFDVFRYVEQVVRAHRDRGISGVIGTGDYPECFLAAATAEALGLRAPKTREVVRFSHKLYSREIQRQHVPEATPTWFAAFDPLDKKRPPLDYPCFVKPVKGTMSMYARLVNTDRELRDTLRFPLRERITKRVLLRPFQQLLDAHTDGRVPAHYFIAESPLRGWQVTVDGFVARGRAEIMGVVDSVMYPGTMSFQRFEYPSRLSREVQSRMGAIAKRLMEGSGFDQSCFNVEMFYDATEDRIHVIEVNPRMSYQFADLYEKVDGTSTYAIQIALATDEPVEWHPGKGACRAAASFVLRRFEDATVLRVPSPEEIAALEARFPGTSIKILCHAKERLSDHDQDVGSFRYGIVNLGAPNAEELHARYAEVAGALDVRFAS